MSVKLFLIALNRSETREIHTFGLIFFFCQPQIIQSLVKSKKKVPTFFIWIGYCKLVFVDRLLCFHNEIFKERP